MTDWPLSWQNSNHWLPFVFLGTCIIPCASCKCIYIKHLHPFNLYQFVVKLWLPNHNALFNKLNCKIATRFTLLRFLIYFIKRNFNFLIYYISYTFWKGNMIADILAKLGARAPSNLVILNIPSVIPSCGCHGSSVPYSRVWSLFYAFFNFDLFFSCNREKNDIQHF